MVDIEPFVTVLKLSRLFLAAVHFSFFLLSKIMVIRLSGVQLGLISVSRVRLQTELDSTHSYYQLTIKITISEKTVAKL